MKKTAFFLFAALLSLNVAAQSFEIKMSVDTIETHKRNSQTGGYDYFSSQGTKSSVHITDSVITVTDDLGRETKYRVFTGQGTVYEQTEVSPIGKVVYSVINDKTGEYFQAAFVKGEFQTTFALSNDLKILVFYGKEN